jgi:hypothetical protein
VELAPRPCRGHLERLDQPSAVDERMPAPPPGRGATLAAVEALGELVQTGLLAQGVADRAAARIDAEIGHRRI